MAGKTSGNVNLSAAKTAKKDEFYTQLTDIEKEMRYYRKHFKDKAVLCNCDDPFESNFFKYFVLNFNRLGLKKLIATCYTGSPIANKQLSIFDILGESEETQNKPYKAVVTTVYDKTGDGGVDMLDVAELFKSGENELTELKGMGISVPRNVWSFWMRQTSWSRILLFRCSVNTWEHWWSIRSTSSLLEM